MLLKEEQNVIINYITKPNVYLAATLNGRAIGYIRFKSDINEKSGTVVMGVLKEHSGKAVGEKLIESLFRVLKSLEVTCLVLSVKVNNNAAQALYKRMGFVFVTSNNSTHYKMIRYI
jgi:ribosomal protein S18 acetylase RimI-like enzyme